MKAFKYLGHTFTPIRNFKGREGSFKSISKHLKSIGINAYRGKYEWDNFIAACKKVNNKALDLYQMDNGKVVCPCTNELFEYTKPAI